MVAVLGASGTQNLHGDAGAGQLDWRVPRCKLAGGLQDIGRAHAVAKVELDIR